MATSTVDGGGPVGIKKVLLEALDAIKSSGTFASQGKLPHVDPQIKVQDVGAISLPLQESQVRQMMKQAHQAPYGKGSETLVDTAVRNTMELNPDQFELGNPDWDSYVKQACACVAQDLGVDSPVSAELYKMLIYEKGAMFKPHTEADFALNSTEKAPGMFATLVIGLPSPFEGGEVAVKHQGKRLILTTLQHGFSYVSWYSDVVHEVLPVKSGYRWVLTYNLCIDPSRPCPTACLHTDEARHLHRILKAWLNQNTREERELSHAYYRLDHEYTQASISLNALKGRDLASVHLLKEISNDLNLEIFLAVIAKGQMGPCRYDDRYSRNSYRPYNSYYDNIYSDNYDVGHHGRSGAIHDLEEIINTSYETDTLVGLDGCEVMKSMALKKDNVLQKECFDVDPEEDYMGFQGNFGPEATHWYRVAAVVIVPRDSIAHFLKLSPERTGLYTYSECQGNKTSIIGYLAKSLLHTPDDQFLIKTLRDLCQEVWTVSESRVVLPQAIITKVVQAAIILKDQEFVKDAADRHEGNLSLDFFTWAQEQIAAGLITFDTIKDSVLRAILTFPVLWKRQVAVNNFVPPNESMSDDVRSLVQRVHNKILEMIPQQDLGRQDGHAVVDMIPGYHDFSYLSSRYVVQRHISFITVLTSSSVAPLVETRLPDTSFIFAFLSRLDQRTTEGAFPTEDGTDLYKQVAKLFVDKIDVRTLTSDSDELSAKAARLAYSPEEPQPASLPKSSVVTHEILAKFFSTLIRITSDSDSIVGVLSRRICSHAPAIEASAFHSLWLPFLHALVRVCEANSIPTSTPDYQQIFAAILKAYINNYVGERPSHDGNYVRPTVGHCCADCISLNRFLSDPTRTVGRFSVNQKRRQHLHRRLDAAGIDCTHETERSGSPQTFVVTKSFRRHERDFAAWRKRKAEAGVKLLDFNKTDLIAWFGEEYEGLMGMVGRRPSSGRRPPRTLLLPSQSPAPVLPNQQTRPRKRKAADN
ncbi:hypothetical protein N7519_001957 [Penicillium mononematosum]|uniref:uncharacterized protein n=1 Tax=Penicillium mononematosum TaxID=268346 RepID=UPI0025495878|nr:uncharacterized protein N7519_001957 [Penicillium mononematosum]KAJ6187049.1 hypothetical protein N7519_001957 [Penicillium mononematosum]